MSNPEISQSKVGDGEEFIEDSECRIYNKTCNRCGGKFSINIPKHYFNERGEIDNLPTGITKEIIEDIIAKDKCENCK